MGQAAITLKIMPESAEADMEKIKKEIEKFEKIQDSKIEPLAFGLKCLKILVLRDDKKDGGTDSLEEKIKKIKGVAEVETEGVTLL